VLLTELDVIDENDDEKGDVDYDYNYVQNNIFMLKGPEVLTRLKNPVIMI
jgi:hypothetical protein